MNFSKFTFYCLGFALFLGCAEDIPELGDIIAPTNLVVVPSIETDGSGLVTFTATADNVLNYHFFFGNGANEEAFVSSDGLAQNFYKKTGTHIYPVRVVAYGPGGIASNTSLEVEVFVDFRLSDDFRTNLFGNGTKNWYWKQSVAGHLGVGPPEENGEVVSDPKWYQSGINEKVDVGCLYEDVMTFIDNGDDTYSFTLSNNGVTYFHIDEARDELGVPKPASDQCYDYDIGGTKDLAFSAIASGVSPTTGINMEISGRGFLSYFLNSSSYEIMSLTDEEMRTRTIQDVDGFQLAWYHTFTSRQDVTPSCTGSTGAAAMGNKDVLIWSDEFDGTELCLGDWGFDLGASGWGNGEAQYYTDRPENILVEDGVLKIIAQREEFSGAPFTSSRIKTQGKFDFTYGRIEARAKLPTGGGTWPAIWALGSSISTVGWPECGEIDIMEHVGNNQDVIHGTAHYPGRSGGDANGSNRMVAGVSSDFHIYAVEWDASKITFEVDGTIYHTINNDSSIPFNDDFFLIMNVAMGGSFGGEIDPSFQSSTMEVDYIRVYQ